MSFSGISGAIFVILNLATLEFVKSNNQPTFMISFQTAGKDTTDEWAEYKGKMQSLKEFTICNWFNLKFFQYDTNCLWSYCFLTIPNTEIECFDIEISLTMPSGNRDIKVEAWMARKQNNTITAVDIVHYQHRIWNHICWTYSSNLGSSSIYYLSLIHI